MSTFCIRVATLIQKIVKVVSLSRWLGPDICWPGVLEACDPRGCLGLCGLAPWHSELTKMCWRSQSRKAKHRHIEISEVEIEHEQSIIEQCKSGAQKKNSNIGCLLSQSGQVPKSQSPEILNNPQTANSRSPEVPKSRTLKTPKS